MRGRTGFHAHQAEQELGRKAEQPRAGQLLAKDADAARIGVMQLKERFAESIPTPDRFRWWQSQP